MTAGRDRLRVLLDVSPIVARPEGRTGLSRVALSLGLALAERPDIDLRTCAWGSLIASDDFHSVRNEFPSLGGLSPQSGAWSDYCTRTVRSAGSRKRWSAGMWRFASQVTNRLRNPLAGVDVAAFDLAHSTYARFPRIIRSARLPTVLTVHDVMPLRLPAEFLPAGQLAITRRILHSIRPHDWVACVSEWTRRDFLDATGHPPERTVVIPNGVDTFLFYPDVATPEAVAVRKRYRLAEHPYCLTLSSLAPHKNMRFLLDAWARSGVGNAGGMLVMAGGRSADVNQILKALGLETLPRGVVLTGHVSDEAFRCLATGCQAFLFPSLYEGFGLPVLEAMACGSPVIASHRTSIPEVVGDAGLLLDPLDSDAWAQAIKSAVTTVWKAPHAASVRQSQVFSWQAAADHYAALYRSILA